MSTARTPAARWLIPTGLLIVGLVATSCGERPAPAPVRHQPVVVLEAVSDADKARFALDRILNGPLPRSARFPIPEIHTLNIEYAREDLAALPDETVRLLSDPDRIRRLTRGVGDRNPWHNVVDLLARLPDLPADLVVSWTEPALAANDLPLDRRAVNALTAVRDTTATAPLLLAFLEARPRDREVAPRAIRALVHAGSPWRERALTLAWGKSTRAIWDQVTSFFGSLTGEAGALDALTTWALLTDTSGPCVMRSSARNVVVPWWPGRLVLDDTVWPSDPFELEAALHAGRVVSPADVIDGGGFLVEDIDASPVVAWRQMVTSGRPAAARARCTLAAAGHAAYGATLARDMEGNDTELRGIGAHCAGIHREDALELSRALLDAFLDDLEAGLVPDVTGIESAFLQLVAASRKEGTAYALRLLEKARPVAAYKELLVSSHDVAYQGDRVALRALVIGLARGQDSADRGLGLLLIRRGRDPAYAPVLDARLEGADPSTGRSLRRLLIWLHSRPGAVEPEVLEAFARRYGSWIETSGDDEARALASGLLDLGDPGVAAYAAGLRGPQRHVFIQGLHGRPGLVPLSVALALLEPVDASTPAAERQAVLVAAYRSAPTSAAPALAAARARLARGARSDADDVLEVLRHRAER